MTRLQKKLLILAVALGVLSFGGIGFAAEVTLAWDANQEADLAGYGVYFKKGSAGPPYEFFGYFEEADLSPDAPAATVNGLELGATYYFAVTAFDSADNESTYSNPVCAQVNTVVVPCGSADTTGSGSGASQSIDPSSSVTAPAHASSGGGGGCFIQSVLPGL